MKAKFVAAGVLTATLGLGLSEQSAQAQTAIPPTVARDSNWATVSHASMLIGVGTVSLMPRVYYSSPDATVGWKGRWHFSSLAPIMTMTGLTLLVDGPIKNALQSPKAGCLVEDTTSKLDGSGCETFGGPSTHAFASWGATGAGIGIFLMDTFKYSDSKLSGPAMIGNVGVPLVASVMTSVARSADGNGTGPESTGQVLAGALTGAASGLLIGLTYAYLQEPDCGYGGYLLCW